MLLDIFTKLEKGDPINVSILPKYRINQQLVQTYVEKYDCRPSTKNKLDLSKDIGNAFPVLKGSDDEGHVSTEDSSVEFFQKQQWLKGNASPLEKVIQLMQETFEGRRFEIMRNTTNFVSNWPRILWTHML
ncbi:hypothetical protein TNCT_21761 [Trichonephila clavata]|uniref:Uncharacterized protein n=1 Tax=Trichonephila clavata TaxID=2740835 RepID=A0A8X6F330_TRICU|nr:hypothetical protein TNCT_21761 [Trichonephila clavata]